MIRPLLVEAGLRTFRNSCLRQRDLLFPRPEELEEKKWPAGASMRQSSSNETKSGSSCELSKQGKQQLELLLLQPRRPSMGA